jgi:hypothetical protein
MFCCLCNFSVLFLYKGNQPVMAAQQRRQNKPNDNEIENSRVNADRKVAEQRKSAAYLYA